MNEVQRREPDRPDRRIVLTCEHGGNEVPEHFQFIFSAPGAAADLLSHRGYDPGALTAASTLANRLKCPLIASSTTRLLVDLNRSLDSDELFSRYSRLLPASSQEEVLREYYHPYQRDVRRLIKQHCAGDSSIARQINHFSVHTFTPKRNGISRSFDVGLLFDPGRSGERITCERIATNLQQSIPRLRVRMNQPYLGTDDGLTTNLRCEFDESEYLGMEIEINQRLFKRSLGRFHRIVDALADSICSR